MKILIYGENIDWIRQAASISEIVEGDLYGVTPSRELAEDAAKILDRVYFFDSEVYEPNTYSRIILKVSELVSPSLTIFPSTIRGRTIAGLYAGPRKEEVVTDVVDVKPVDDSLELKRLVYGGSCIATLRIRLPATLCLSPGAFKPTGRTAAGEVVEVEGQAVLEAKFSPRAREGAPLERAEVVVVAGRGFKSKEDLEMVKELSSRLNGAWSVTRPLAADFGWADTWIGISGATVSPKIYIAIGVSGQPLHMIAARNSKIVIAVNKDPAAPIFEEADYGVIGDLYQVLPRLIKRLGGRP